MARAVASPFSSIRAPAQIYVEGGTFRKIRGARDREKSRVIGPI